MMECLNYQDTQIFDFGIIDDTLDSISFVEKMVFQLNSLYFNTLEDLDFSKLNEEDIKNRKNE